MTAYYTIYVSSSSVICLFTQSFFCDTNCIVNRKSLKVEFEGSQQVKNLLARICTAVELCKYLK